MGFVATIDLAAVEDTSFVFAILIWGLIGGRVVGLGGTFSSPCRREARLSANFDAASFGRFLPTPNGYAAASTAGGPRK